MKERANFQVQEPHCALCWTLATFNVFEKGFDISNTQDNTYEHDQNTQKLFPTLAEYLVNEINGNLYVCPVLQRVDLSILLSDNFLKISGLQGFFSLHGYAPKS